MINNKKQRPPNGPGSNGLRGGINLYSNKTAIAGWMDDVGGPSGYKRGFSTNDFQTEAQAQQLGASLRSDQYFGASLPRPRIVNDGPEAPYGSSREINKDEIWITNTQLLQKSVLNKTRESHMPGSNVHGEELEQYRKTWSSDVPVSRELRFQTESRRATHYAPEKFKVHTVRMLPGTPIALERIREKLSTRFGVLALAVLKFNVGKGTIGIDQLRVALTNAEVKLTGAEFNQIIAYFTPSSTLSADQFIRVIIGRIDGFNPTQPRTLFREISGGASSIPLDVVTGQMSTREFPEIVEGVQRFGAAYAATVTGSSDEEVLALTEEGFVALHSDMYASVPYDYENVMEKIWS